MNLAILVGSGLIVVSILTSLISFRIGAPLLLVFLIVGLAAGEDGIGHIPFSNAPAAYFIGSIALAVILFDSGFGTPVHSYRIAVWPALTLATVGVLLTTAVIAMVARPLLGLSWIEALLIGAIVSSTDAAAVFFLLRVGGITLRDRVRSTLEIESATNDPMAIFLTIAIVGVAVGAASPGGIPWSVLGAFAQQLVIGLVLGVAGGLVIVQAVNRINLEPGLFPIAVLSMALALFAATGMLDGSGFLAVYVAGLVVGNAKVRSGAALLRFQTGMTWLSQIGMFLTLGLLATPSRFPAVAGAAVLLALALILVARPLAVWLCLLPFGFSRNETTFVAWVGLRGAVSILLAILPVMAGLPNAQEIFNVAFIVVLCSLLVQGWTVRPLARWLGLIVPPRVGPVERVELELPGRASHELVAYHLAPDSPVARGLRIPRWARPSLVVRQGRSMRFHTAGRLQAGDYVYLFVPPRQVPLLDKLFARPRELGEDDRDFLGDFTLSPHATLADLSDSYGLHIGDADKALTLGEFLVREFAGRVEAGDRLSLGPVELIVRSVDAEDAVTEVGLAIEPSRAARPKLPLFQNPRELRALFARRLGWARRKPPA